MSSHPEQSLVDVSSEMDPHLARVYDYYFATTEKSYLSGWSKDSPGFHFGLADAQTASHAESLDNTNRYLAERAGINRQSRVLDAGCGVGGSALWLAKNLGCEVVGITLVPRQVEIANRLAREEGLENLVRFERMNMLDTSFPEAHFDVVWNLESMCHVIDIDAYLAHVKWLLRDGGRFACIDECKLATCSSDLERRVVSGWALAPMRLPEEIVASMGAAGLEHAEHVNLTDRALLSAQAMRAMASRTALKLKAERAFLGKEDPVYEAHVDAALAMAEGMETGQTTLSHFSAVRPARG